MKRLESGTDLSKQELRVGDLLEGFHDWKPVGKDRKLWGRDDYGNVIKDEYGEPKLTFEDSKFYWTKVLNTPFGTMVPFGICRPLTIQQVLRLRERPTTWGTVNTVEMGGENGEMAHYFIIVKVYPETGKIQSIKRERFDHPANGVVGKLISRLDREYSGTRVDHVRGGYFDDLKGFL